MGGAGRLGAESNQFLKGRLCSRVGIGGHRYGEQEVGIGRDPHVIGVLRKILIAQGVGASGDGLATEIRAALGKADYRDEFAIRKFGVQRTSGVLSCYGKWVRKPEFRCPAIV